MSDQPAPKTKTLNPDFFAEIVKDSPDHLSPPAPVPSLPPPPEPLLLEPSEPLPPLSINPPLLSPSSLPLTPLPATVSSIRPHQHRRKLPKTLLILFFLFLSSITIFIILKKIGLITFSQSKSHAQLQATPPPTASFRDYSNAQFNLSFKYPSTTHLKINSIPDSLLLGITLESGSFPTFSLDANQDYSPEDIVTLSGTKSSSQRIIASHLWQVFYISPPTPSTNNQESITPGFALRLENNGTLYTLFFPNQSDTLPAQDQILSTITFIEPVSEPTEETLPVYKPQLDIANWQSYTNKKYNYQLKYPRDWTYTEKSETAPSWFQNENKNAWIQYIVFSSPSRQINLHFSLKKITESNIRLSAKSGVGGEFVPKGIINIANQPVEIDQVVYKNDAGDKVLEIFYSNGLFTLKDTEIASYLYYDPKVASSSAVVDIDKTKEYTQANEILSSFQFLN